MVKFYYLDWLWLILYLLLMTICGIIFYRLGKRSEADFFLAGRGLPWWIPGVSVYATHTATDTPMWVSGVIYKYGLRGLWYTFFSAWCAISAFVSARIFRRSLAYSQAEWQSLRYSGLGAELLRGWMSGWGSFLNMFILGWVGMAMGKLCNYLFGWETWIGLVIPSMVVAVYVLSAGYWGVVMADFQQGIIAFFVIIFSSLWGVGVAGGPSGVLEKLSKIGESWRINPLHFSGFFTGDFPLAWFLTMIFIAVLGGFGMGTSLDWYTEAQRIQSSRTIRDASYSIWWGTALTLTRNSIWAVAILAFFAIHPFIKNPSEYEMAWYRIAFENLPTGFAGFLLAGIAATHFSTISTHLNLGAVYMTRDLYHHYMNPDASEKTLVLSGRISTLLLLIGSFIYGTMMEEITKWLIFALWIMGAGMWLPNILQVIWWKFNSWGYLSAWIANLGFSWLVVWILPAFGVIPELPDYLQFWVLMILTALVYIPVTLLTKPENMKHLAKYYAMTKPIGFWKPVKEEAIKLGLIKEDK